MEEEKLSQDEQLFLTLVSNFQITAWIRMGKIKDPLTDSINRNLDDCRFSIDMIDMLNRRMKGSLTEREDKYLQRLLPELRMNYLEELAKDQKKSSDSEASSSDEADTPSDSPSSD